MVDVAIAHPIPPGANAGDINSYVPDGNPADLLTLCTLYASFVNIVQELYPKPAGVLRKALIINLEYLYSVIRGQCIELHPYETE